MSDFRYLEKLKTEFASRCDRNPRYSLRAFAKAMDFDPGLMSRILNQKHVPSIKASQRIVEKLNLAPQEQDEFLKSIIQNLRVAPRPASAVSKNIERSLDVENFRIISEWYHYAILELSFTKNASANPRNIAKALGISQAEANLALDRLTKLGLLSIRDGQLVKTDKLLSIGDKDKSSPALRKRQKQILEKSIFSLENDPIEYRSHSAMTFAIDVEKLSSARKKIAKFTKEMTKLLAQGEDRKVYELSISLFPIQNLGEKP